MPSTGWPPANRSSRRDGRLQGLRNWVLFQEAARSSEVSCHDQETERRDARPDRSGEREDPWAACDHVPDHEQHAAEHHKPTGAQTGPAQREVARRVRTNPTTPMARPTT